MQTRRFTTNDAEFVCTNCGLDVAPLGTTSRNHCPRCLCSLHVDVNPGDRGCSCRGLMRPVGVEIGGRRGYVLVHRCERCGALRRNRAVPDAAVQPDDFDRIVELSLGGAPRSPDGAGDHRGWSPDGAPDGAGDHRGKRRGGRRNR